MAKETEEISQVRREESHFQKLRNEADEKKHEGLNHLVRQELELEQFECEKWNVMMCEECFPKLKPEDIADKYNEIIMMRQQTI